MDANNFRGLINSKEHEGLDFKLEYYKDNLSLIHDVLCMENANINDDRYIIFGISDGKKSVGLNEDIRHNQNDLIQVIRDAKPNRSLYNGIKLEEPEIDGKKYAIIIIKNRPDKPFFLNQDYPDLSKTKTIRAGVIYTRNADGNTPINKSALDDEIELMWRERFCLNLPPFERFCSYLTSEEWAKASDDTYYCKQYPEFRISCFSNELIDDKVPENDRWMPEYWINVGKILKTVYKLTYFGMDVYEKEIMVWWCDNGREPVPLPEIESENTGIIGSPKMKYSWKLSKQSPKYKVGNIIAKIHSKDLENILRKTKIDVD